MATTHLKAAAGGAGGSWCVLMEGLARLVAERHPRVHIEVAEGGAWPTVRVWGPENSRWGY